MRVTRPVRSRVVQGRPDAGVAWAYINSGWEEVGPHNSRAASCERMHPNLGGQDDAIAVNLVLSKPVPRSQSVDGSAGDGASGYRCATSAG